MCVYIYIYVHIHTYTIQTQINEKTDIANCMSCPFCHFGVVHVRFEIAVEQENSITYRLANLPRPSRPSPRTSSRPGSGIDKCPAFRNTCRALSCRAWQAWIKKSPWSNHIKSRYHYFLLMMGPGLTQATFELIWSIGRIIDWNGC